MSQVVIVSQERFTTMSMLTVLKPSEKFPNAQQTHTLERQKSKKMVRDINLSTVKTTEQRMANAHVSYTPQTSHLATGKSSDLPNFHRYFDIRITFGFLISIMQTSTTDYYISRIQSVKKYRTVCLCVELDLH